MKKRILAMVLALTMVFTLVGVSAAEITSTSSLKDVIVDYVNGNGLDDVKVFVPLDIQLRDENATEWSEGLTVRTASESGIPKFDFLATLDMSAVGDAFDMLVVKAGQAIEAKAVDDTHKATLYGELEDVVVTGTFTITISLPDGISFSDSHKTNNNMEEFNAEAKLIFKESAARTVSTDGKTITLTLAVQDNQTKADLEDKIAAPITFQVDDVAIAAFGTYKLEGKLEGSTNISDIAVVKYKTTPLGEVGSVDHNPDKTAAPWASASVDAARKSGGGGGGASGGGSTTPADKEYKVEFVIDGKVHSSTTTDGKINTSEITPAEKEGYDFAGWYLDEGFTKPAPATLEVTANTKIYGKYTESGSASSDNKVDIVVDGAVVGTVEAVDGKIDIGSLEAPEKEGYELVGWSSSADGTSVLEGIVEVVDGMKLYPKYILAGLKDIPVLNAEEHGAYIIGYTDGTVRPLNNIVREEVATIFFRLLTEKAGEVMHKDVAPYSDVPATKWSSTAIATLANGGYITGRPDGTFGPNDYITRAEFAAIAARLAGAIKGENVAFSDVQKHWAKNYIEACAASGLITGYTDGTFKPDQYITRAEAMAIVNRMLDRAVDAEGIAAVKDDIYYFGDNAENTWCYYIVLEATNAHDYTKAEDGKETWTKITEVRDWTVYEK